MKKQREPKYSTNTPYLTRYIVHRAYQFAQLTGICSVYIANGVLTFDGSPDPPKKANIALSIVRSTK